MNTLKKVANASSKKKVKMTAKKKKRRLPVPAKNQKRDPSRYFSKSVWTKRIAFPREAVTLKYNANITSLKDTKPTI